MSKSDHQLLNAVFDMLFQLYGCACRTGGLVPSPTARLELRISPEKKELIERAARLTNLTLTAFVTNTVVARARQLVEGPAQTPEGGPRPIGGWSFVLPEDWDDPLDDFADYR